MIGQRGYAVSKYNSKEPLPIPTKESSQSYWRGKFWHWELSQTDKFNRKKCTLQIYYQKSRDNFVLDFNICFMMLLNLNLWKYLVFVTLTLFWENSLFLGDFTWFGESPVLWYLIAVSFYFFVLGLWDSFHGRSEMDYTALSEYSYKQWKIEQEENIYTVDPKMGTLNSDLFASHSGHGTRRTF